MCVTVVQWSRSFLHVQINRVRLPATLLSVSLYLFFIPFGLFFFNTIFPFGLFFFILTADPAGHALGSIYIFKLKVSALANFQHFILPPKSFYRKFRWCNMHIWCSFLNTPSHLRYLHRQILRIFASLLVVILRIISICHHIDSIPQFLRN